MRFDCGRPGKADKGLRRRHLMKATGLSRAQVTRPIAQQAATGRIAAPAKSFPRVYWETALCVRQCADTTLGVLSVHPEVDGYGDELLLIRFTYDDSNGAKGLPDSLVRIRLNDRLHTELQGADVEAFPVVSFIAESEVGKEPE